MTSSVIPRPTSRFGLLCRVRYRTVYNRLAQVVDEAPLRLATAVVMILLIWVGLYGLFHLVFDQLRRTPLEATVAIPLVFDFFFLAMLVLLTISNAIIVYGSLFSRDESVFLLSAPLAPVDVVTVKYAESLALASWALVLLGFPLMMSMAGLSGNRAFYWLFLAFFVGFLPIPGALGLILAWVAARWLPQRVLPAMTATTVLVLAVTLLLVVRALQFGDADIQHWLNSFQQRLGFIQFALMPNHWVAKGIDHARNENIGEAVRYLCVTAVNGLFLSWVAVLTVSRNLDTALDGAASRSGGARRPPSHPSGGLAGRAFFYLPRPLRLIAAKDLRTFLRDPMQWSQLAILFGLLALYLTNMPTLRLQLSGWGWYLIIPFLNLCAVSLILATFTCRFVFPLMSLEGRKLWLLGLLPISRGRVVIAKFAFAMTITLLVGFAAMMMAAMILRLTLVWTLIHLAVTFGICCALCGLSVGLGARLPSFHESNAARIANGLGGTTNLLASLVTVSVVLTAIGWATYQSRDLPEDAPPDATALLVYGAATTLAVLVGLFLLFLGGRHFQRVEV